MVLSWTPKAQIEQTDANLPSASDKALFYAVLSNMELHIADCRCCYIEEGRENQERINAQGVPKV